MNRFERRMVNFIRKLSEREKLAVYVFAERLASGRIAARRRKSHA
jgi:hypothetical protein